MKTGVLIGGTSPEREVSLMSGEQIVAALQRLGEDVLMMDPQDADWMDKLPEVSRVFNILHGGVGEDGSMRGLLNCLNIACTGSGVLGSALAMDKGKCKTIWRDAQMPTADWAVVAGGDVAAPEAVLDTLALPYFVKPVMGGSSLNAGIVRDAAAFKNAIGKSAEMMLVETLIDGGEYTVSLLNGEALPVIHIAPPPQSPFYDYHAKYISDETQFYCPCDLDQRTQQKMCDLSLRAFELVGCSQWGRLDLMMSADGEMHLLEINTVPGMTSHSLVPKAAAAVGIGFDELVRRILAGAYCE